jgi:hypothetical protein
MNTRTLGLSRFQWILVGVLVVQIILAVVVNLPRNTRAESSPLVDDFDPTSIKDLVIENQSTAKLHLAEDNGEWVLPEAGDYPANAEKVTEVLGKIQNIKTNRLVTQTTASHKQLQVADDNFIGRVTFTDSNGKSQKIYIGSSAGSGATHVRLDGMNQVYLTSELTSWEVTPAVSSWIDTTYITLDQDQLQTLRIENANGSFSFHKDESGKWTLDDLNEGEQLDSTGLETKISRFTTLRMVEPLGTSSQASWGLNQPLATAVFGLADGTTVSIAVGAQAENGNYVIKASNSPYYVDIAAITAESLINMDRASLLLQPTPTPTPAP